jgi:hypothetical protein
MARNRSRKRSSSSSKVVLWWVVGGLLALMFVLIPAVGLVYFTMKPGGGKPLFDTGNANVSADGFAKIEDGMTKEELEALLGSSCLPDEKDFEAVVVHDRFGGGNSQSFEVQGMMSQRHLVCAWSRRKVLILVAFHKPPNEGGLCLTRVLRDADGGITYISGNQQKIYEKERLSKFGGNQQKLVPSQPLPPGESNTTAVALHGEFVANAAAAKAKYIGQTLTITGTIKAKLPGAVFLTGSTDKGLVTTTFNAEDGLKLQQKNTGDSITFTGKVLGYTDANQMLTFDRSTIVN